MSDTNDTFTGVVCGIQSRRDGGGYHLACKTDPSAEIRSFEVRPGTPTYLNGVEIYTADFDDLSGVRPGCMANVVMTPDAASRIIRVEFACGA
jgi:hypothetical protein